MSKTLEELRAELRDPIGKVDEDGYIRLPDYDALSTFGLDPKKWLRKDWHEGKCAGWHEATREANFDRAPPCPNRSVAQFPPLVEGPPDVMLCYECACRYAAFHTKFWRARHDAARRKRRENGNT